MHHYRFWVQSRAVSQPVRNRETHEVTDNWPNIVRIRAGFGQPDVLVSTHSIDSCGWPGACTLTWFPVVGCFLHDIGVTGFRFRRAVCQEAVRLGRVVFRHGS